jgi:hypothetical protein
MNLHLLSGNIGYAELSRIAEVKGLLWAIGLQAYAIIVHSTEMKTVMEFSTMSVTHLSFK